MAREQRQMVAVPLSIHSGISRACTVADGHPRLGQIGLLAVPYLQALDHVQSARHGRYR